MKTYSAVFFRNGPMSIASSVLCMLARVLASIAVDPEISPPALLITCCATSNAAIVMFIVFVITVTATKVLNIHFQKIHDA